LQRDAGSDGPVLFAYDSSDEARAAIEQAGRQLRTGRRAIVLSVWQPLESLPFWGAPVAMVPATVAEEVHEEASRVAEEGAQRAKQAGFEAEAAAVEGTPVWRRIIEVADERGAEIIVIGSHGRSAVGYLAMGSVATAVAHHANVPVFICRHPS
jgi:nucleotide-binding universal stress UspA family protein